MVNWRNVFGGKKNDDLMDQAAFARYAVNILNDRFHGSEFRVSEQPLAILFGNDVFGVHSTYSAYKRDKLTESVLRDLLITHFERMLADSGMKSGPQPPPWAEASKKLRPQLMPIEYLEQAPAPLLSWKLNADVAIGIVLDQENTYSYVRTQDPECWAQSAETVRELATQNLNSASAGIEIHSADGPDKFMAVESGDGYDAARILIPQLRGYFASRLGSPFYAGIPNRDFMICWSRSCSDGFHEFARKKVASDFGTQPYSLTAEIIIATPESLEPETAG